MQNIKLNTGNSMPVIGFGTWEVVPDSAARQAVESALRVGYRLLDTAKVYGNEAGVGQAIRESNIKREEIFVTTKLWNEDQGYESTLEAIDDSLKRLQLDYADLYLIHWPQTGTRRESWRAMEQVHQSGKAKNVGVSNYTIRHLEELLSESTLVPAVNQVEFHPYIYADQKPLLEFCKAHGIVLEAYSPLSKGTRKSHGTIARIAKKHQKSEQQVTLRWCLQHGTVPLPRSTNPEHMKDNFDIFSFELDDEDMATLDGLSTGERVTWDPSDIR